MKRIGQGPSYVSCIVKHRNWVVESRVYKWVLHLPGPAPYWGLHLAGSAPNDDQRDDDSLDNTCLQYIGSKR